LEQQYLRVHLRMVFQEGYQTFDAIAAIVVGGVIIVSINLKNTHATYEDKKTLIRKSRMVSGFELVFDLFGTNPYRGTFL